MKKFLALMMSLVMIFALTACGGNNGGTANKYNLDMKSTEVQPMSSERASADVLSETAETYFNGLNYFEGSDLANLTYDDVIGHIGVDASEYRYDDTRQAELYTWYADGNEKASLNVWFIDGKLDASGAINL